MRLWGLWITMKMGLMRIERVSKMKKKLLTAHEKAVILMNRETNRAVSRVEMLEKLYLETVKAKEVIK